MAVSETLNLKVQNTISEISVNVISIPEDRLENILIKHVVNFKRSKDIIGASGTLLAILTTLLTSVFKDFWLEAEAWKGIFIVAMIASVVYFFRVLWNTIKNRDNIENIMSDIKSAKSEKRHDNNENNSTKSPNPKKRKNRNRKNKKNMGR